MGLTYKKDKHLDFLSDVDNESLEVLVELLTKDKDGLERVAGELTMEPRYKKHQPNHNEYWDLIAAEYQSFGGNTFVNLVRGGGVSYEEILTDVCGKMKVELPKNPTVETMENNLIQKVLEQSLDEMTDEQKRGFLTDLDIKTMGISKQAVMAAIQTAMLQGGFATYQLAVVVANTVAKQIVGHGLKLAVNAGITRAIGIAAGPIGWFITGAWTVVDLAGPANRVIIPATIYIASLRLAKSNEMSVNTKQQFNASNAKTCPQCGLKLDISAKFCSNCGEKISKI